MKKTFKQVLLVVSCMVIPFGSYANTNQDLAAKNLAEGAKRNLLSIYGKFPIKLDNVSQLTDITSSKQNIIYDYNVTMESGLLTSEILAEALKESQKDSVCSVPVFVQTFKENDLRFLYRYQFSDKKIIPVTLSIDDMCD
ncbi:hypothetical protein [Candidatus Schmidhempelia bombi]|uniref:Uncharacterized protein n=1 Tax=Candidatus Schmidhempelia bombi str. Bimp TaxID=1387197 RepID=A0AB94IET9_9GAMM|nr:hypothetical protein [Candidatus Schmidhempelia bombi]TEA28027.1 hypothetical protein O970_00975 [Candidatus Schmidhempelia bombi str. Bimp]